MSVREHRPISGTAGPIFAKFCVQISHGRGLVHLRRRCDTRAESDVYECLVFSYPPYHSVGRILSLLCHAFVTFYSTLVGVRSIAINPSVCLSVCLCVCLSRAYLWNCWIDRHKIFVQVPCGRGLVLFWRRCDMLCTSVLRMMQCCRQVGSTRGSGRVGSRFLQAVQLLVSEN